MTNSTSVFRTRAGLTLLTLAALVVSPGQGLGDEVADTIGLLEKAGRKERLEIIEKLAATKDSRAGVALVEQLDRTIADADEREEFWLHLLRALWGQVATGNLTKSVLPRLDELARTKPTVTVEVIPERTPVRVPKYDFRSEAEALAGAVRRHLARAELQSELARTSDASKLRLLIDKAWMSASAKELWTRSAARQMLRKLGRDGVAPTVRAVADAPKDHHLDMAEYFFDTFQATQDKDCVQGLLLLTKSEEVAVWQDAILKIGETRSELAAEPLVQLIKESEKVPMRAALALETLGTVGTKAQIPFLVEQLARENVHTRSGAASALKAFGKEAVPALKDALKSNDPAQRAGAVSALIGLKGPERSEVLRGFLRDNSDEDPVLLKRIRKALDQETGPR